MGATAILPIKRFNAAKQRLHEVLEAEERAALARAMLADVLGAIGRCENIERTILVSGEPLAAALTTPDSVDLIDDPDDAGHRVAAELGVAEASRRGAGRVALLPGDCPLMDPAEVDAAIAAATGDFVGVIPDRGGSGTNGLVLAPPDAIPPSFGPGSRDRHLRLAAESGCHAELLELESMALDLDTGDDLEALADAVGADPARAPETAAALGAIGRLPR